MRAGRARCRDKCLEDKADTCQLDLRNRDIRDEHGKEAQASMIRNKCTHPGTIPDASIVCLSTEDAEEPITREARHSQGKIFRDDMRTIAGGNAGRRTCPGAYSRFQKRFEAQQMLSMLGGLAHNLIVWARGWLRRKQPKIRHYGIVRMVRDVLQISG